MKRLSLSVALVLVAFFSCYLEDIYLHQRPPQPETRILITLRTHRPFNFDQEKAFGGKRNVAISQYIPLYTFLPDRVRSAKQKMEEAIRKVEALQGQAPLEASTFSKYVKKELGVEISPETAAQLLAYPNLKNLLEGIWTIEEPIQQGKIVEDTEPIKGKHNVEVLYPDPVGTFAHLADEFMPLEKARTNLRKKILQLFWQVDDRILDPAVRIALAILQPNLKYDQKENDRRIEELTRRYPSKIVPYGAGEVLVPFGKILSEEDVLLLEASQAEEKKDLYGRAPWVLLIIALSVTLYNLLLSAGVHSWSRKPPSHCLLLCLLIIAVLLLKACLLFTSISLYALPTGFLPLLLLLLYPERVSVAWTTLLGALLVCLFSGPNLDVLLLFVFGGITAILFCPRIRKWGHVLIPSVAIAVTNALVVFFLLFDWNLLASWLSGADPMNITLLKKMFRYALITRVAWAFIGGLCAGPLALLLLPLLEYGLGTVSSFKLNKYTDLQHPLLRDLLIKAPGTYQHTMTIAHLAQMVGEAVGANTLLLRAGAYYHDIGKTSSPGYFVENQFGGRNPHDELDPAVSCKIIMEHVRHGKSIAAKAGLPDVVVNFIPQHHGTLLVEYFYDKARKASEDPAQILEQDFRYPGPKPQSLEAALLMIVDAVEAASRTLQQPDRDTIQSMIRFILQRRIADGQFDECDLSTRDLGIIVDTLTRSLEAAYHSRIEYPWQKQEERVAEAGSGSKPTDAAPGSLS
jgi:putative nucleotidyltransferase with HDIG domain